MHNVSRDLLSGVLFRSSTHAIWEDLRKHFDKVTTSRMFYLYKFLMGLNDGYSQARSQILMKSHVPNVNQAYAMLLQDESQKLVVGGHCVLTENMEPTALFTTKQYAPVFTPEQYSQILNFLNKTLIGEPSENMADISLSDSDSNPTWIENTGATNHMTGNERLLVDATKVGNSAQVQMPNGDSTQITHVGNCHLTGGDFIKDVLCVPAFKFNILSVSKLTKALQCFVSFYPDFFIFHDLFIGRVKGIGKKEEELYILRPKDNAEIKEQMRSLAVRGITDSELWHKRMGHAIEQNFSFPVISIPSATLEDLVPIPSYVSNQPQAIDSPEIEVFDIAESTPLTANLSPSTSVPILDSELPPVTNLDTPHRKFGRVSKLPIWLKDFVVPGKAAAACLYPSSNVVN
uniref:Uncharacterized protein LOC104223051 n=1 Tax=Nicotiana sylvestris TaxID=4096 RepID=A0A1U7W668_NICSY|nr:PREDICTED: uncharacterized protein LOC104223051 [Nicotiana sylvestris]